MIKSIWKCFFYMGYKDLISSQALYFGVKYGNLISDTSN